MNLGVTRSTPIVVNCVARIHWSPFSPRFSTFGFLIRKRDQVVSKDDLLTAIWNGRIVSDSTLATRINAARNAIGDDGESQRLIRTLPRKGLRFVGDVQEGTVPARAGRTVSAAAGTSARPDEAWRAISPYRGLAAMDETNSAYFFGRNRETVEVLNALATEPDRLPLLLGNSGVRQIVAGAGRRSDDAQERGLGGGLRHRATLAACASGQPELVLSETQPGELPIAKIAETILDTWQLDRTRTEWLQRCADWSANLFGGRLVFNDLLEQTKGRYADLQRPVPSRFFLYIDQGEELYVRADERQRRRFCELTSQAIGDGHLRGMMSLRADSSANCRKTSRSLKFTA